MTLRHCVLKDGFADRRPLHFPAVDDFVINDLGRRTRIGMPVRRTWLVAAKIMDRVGARLSDGNAGRAISSIEIREGFARDAANELGRAVEW
jgi:hypothetical protein